MSGSKIKFYDYHRSSAGYRVRLALNLKELAYDREVVHLLNKEHHHAEYKSINPQGLVPTLVDGKFTLTQSMAIIEYLEEQYPNIPLLPEDYIIRAKIRSVAQVIACDIHPINNLRVLQYLVHELKIDDKAKMKWYFHWLQSGFETIMAIKEPFGFNSDFMFGDMPSMADIFLIPQIYNAIRFEFPMDEFKPLLNIYHLANELEAFDKAKPENQAEHKA